MAKLETIFLQIKAQMAVKMSNIETQALNCVFNNVNMFYAGGTPERYQRTYALGDSGYSWGIQSNGNTCRLRVGLNDAYSYYTGNWSASEVIDAANNGYGGIVGTKGFWTKSEKEIKEIASREFSNFCGTISFF